MFHLGNKNQLLMSWPEAQELVYFILALKIYKLSHNQCQFTNQLIYLNEPQENKFTKPYVF